MSTRRIDTVRTVPILGPEHRSAGYEKSLAVRRARAEYKAQIAAEGWQWLSLHWQLDDLQGMRVFVLLRAVPGVGPSRAQRIMQAAGIDLTRTVARCGERQKERLFAVLDS